MGGCTREILERFCRMERSRLSIASSTFSSCSRENTWRLRRVGKQERRVLELEADCFFCSRTVETAYVRSKYVAQAFVYGDSLQRHVVGVIVPDQEQLMIWAKANGLGNLTFEQLCKNNKAKKMIHNDLKEIGKQNQLHGFEQVKAIHLSPVMFSAENGLLTPTMKSKRNELKAFFKKEIDEMYAKTAKL